MKKLLKSEIFILFIILIIAAFLRLYNITQAPPGLYPDEAIDGNNALEALSKLPSLSGFKVFYQENNGREGLFMNIQAISISLFGNEPWALRIVSVIFGILTVLGVYFLARELFGKNKTGVRIALLSSFLIATSFWHINFSRISFRAIMSPFFMVWALYFLLKALNSEKYKLVSIIGGIFLGLGFYSYIAFRAMPAVMIVVWIFYWIKNKDKAFRKKIIVSAVYFTVFALIIFAPLGIYFLKNPADFLGRTTQVSIFSGANGHPLLIIENLGWNIIKTAGMFNVSGDWNWRHNYAGRPELFLPVGLVFLLGIVLGLKKIFKKGSENSRAFIILFSWAIFAALPVVVSNEGIPHALRSILLIPPAIILAGFGGIWLYEKVTANIETYTKAKKLIIFSIFYLVLFILVFEAYHTYFILWAKNPNTAAAFNADYVAIGRQLNALPKDLPKYVVVQAGGVDVRGIPMPAQTMMYITDTFLPEKQKEKNIYYVLPNQINEIPQGSYVVVLK